MLICNLKQKILYNTLVFDYALRNNESINTYTHVFTVRTKTDCKLLKRSLLTYKIFF